MGDLAGGENMGQKYEGTLIIQTNDNYSPTGDYVLTPLGNQADAAKVLKGYSAYDSYGKVINGTGELGSIENPIIAKTEEEMNKLNVSEFFGKFVKYVGPTTEKYVQNAYYIITEG